jgi:hypothetical protein
MFGWFKPQRVVVQLQAEVAKLRRDLDDRDLDWIEMRARCKRLLDRTEKAQRAIDSATPQEAESQPQELQSNNGEGATTTMGRVLSPRQMEIQQQVLRRRAGIV